MISVAPCKYLLRTHCCQDFSRHCHLEGKQHRIECDLLCLSWHSRQTCSGHQTSHHIVAWIKKWFNNVWSNIKELVDLSRVVHKFVSLVLRYAIVIFIWFYFLSHNFQVRQIQFVLIVFFYPFQQPLVVRFSFFHCIKYFNHIDVFLLSY